MIGMLLLLLLLLLLMLEFLYCIPQGRVESCSNMFVANGNQLNNQLNVMSRGVLYTSLPKANVVCVLVSGLYLITCFGCMPWVYGFECVPLAVT